MEFGFGTKVSPVDYKDSSWIDNAMQDKFNKYILIITV